MQIANIRKNFGMRVKEIRKQKKWTQKELAVKIDISFSQLNKYESGLSIPPIEKLIQLAEIFDTTIDYLLTGDRSDQKPLHNVRMLERFRAMEELDHEDQEAVLKIMDAMIAKSKMKIAIKPFEK